MLSDAARVAVVLLGLFVCLFVFFFPAFSAIAIENVARLTATFGDVLVCRGVGGYKNAHVGSC